MLKEDSPVLGVILFGGVVALSMSHSYVRGRWVAKRSLQRNGSENRKLKRKTTDSLPSQNGKDCGNLFSVHSRNILRNEWREVVSTSTDENATCEVRVINEYNEPLRFCWVDFEGNLRGWRRINDSSIHDGSVSNCHTERTFVGHSFICIKELSPLPRSLKEVDESSFLFLYGPSKSRHLHTITIIREVRSLPFWVRVKQPSVELDVTVKLTCTPSSQNLVTDTTKKLYQLYNMGGFSVNVERGLDISSPSLMETLRQDFIEVSRLLPPNACTLLQQSTPIWINDTMTYGPVDQPVIGRGMCFHPSSDWLKANGLSPEKAGSIEVYSAKEYIDDRVLWYV
jgi:hypothetical protein